MTERWTNGAGATYAAHEHPYRKVLVVEQGSITFTLLRSRADKATAKQNTLTREGRDVLLRAGDTLTLLAGTPHAATVGPDGVTCLETHYQ